MRPQLLLNKRQSTTLVSMIYARIDLSSRNAKMISFDELTVGRWTYALKTGYVATYVLRFGLDGDVIGYKHNNECSWRYNGTLIEFLNEKGDITSQFSKDFSDKDNYILEGVSLISPSTSLVLRRDRNRDWCQLEDSTRLHLKWGVENRGWTIGDHTYGRPHIIEPEIGNLHIGKYTSIASGVTIALGDHDYKNISTYPFKILARYWPGGLGGGDDHAVKGRVYIGNDVWIGANAFISSGVNIADGAVIGAHTVVTKDVPAYSIFVGNPARLLRKRFDDHTIKRLQKISWWEWREEEINRVLPLILSHQTELFLYYAERRSRAR